MAPRNDETPTRRQRRDPRGSGRPSRRSTDGSRRRSGSAAERPSSRTRSSRERTVTRSRNANAPRTARPKRQPSRNLALDGFRAIAILAVLFYHLDVSWLPSGHLGVGMFLVLTGYLVTSSLLRRMRDGVRAIPSFWLSRFLRIWPPMALAIAFTVLTCVIGNHVLLTKARPDILPGLALCENLSYILRNVSYFEQIGGPSPLTHLWYLGIDAQFCLVWPIFMLICAMLPSRATTRRITLVLAVVSAVLMGVLYNPEAGITRVYYGIDTRAFAPLIGAWLAYVMPLGRRPARDLRPLIEQGRMGIELGALVSLVALIIAMVLVPDTSVLLYRGGMFVAALLSALILAALVLPGGALSRLLSLPPLTWLGSRSYGVYLWHYPLIQLFNATANTTPIWQKILVVALSLILAEATHQLIEKPISQLLSPQQGPNGRERRGARSPFLLAGTAAIAIVLVADGVGLAIIPDETLVPEDAIVSTGDDAGHAMDLSKREKSSTTDTAEKTEPQEDIPAADAVLRAPEEEREKGILDPVLIGDSVPGDAQEYWQAACPDGLMDSYVGRRPDQAVTVLDEYLAQGVVGKVVILQAFSNNPAMPEEIDHMIEACGEDRIVFVVNVRIPETEETQINQTIADAVARHDNAHLIDWHSLSEGKTDWIYPDGEHLTPTGQPIYINMLVDAIDEAFTDAGGTITRRNSATETEGSGVVINSEYMDNPGDGGSAADISGDTSSTDETTATDTSTTSTDSSTTDESATSTETTTGADSSTTTTDSSSTASTASSDSDASGSTTQDASMRILMLGNSFTYYNDMPAMLANLTDAEVVTHARGSALLSDQMNSDDQMGQLTLAALNSEEWDYVVLQEMSSRPIRKNKDAYQSSIIELSDLVRANGATPVIFATWPYNEGASRLEKLGITREEMDTQLSDAFAKATSSTGALLADVESAFADAESYDLLYAQDGVHPSAIGSHLAAEIIAKTIEDDQNAKASKDSKAEDTAKKTDKDSSK